MPTRRSVLASPALLAAAPGKDVYAGLGIRPIINFQGTMTTIGASKMPPEVHAAMAEASRHYVPLVELQEKVGARVATLCGTEAALVTCGAAAAIAVGTYGCLTGDDVARVRRLPDLTGMKTRAVIQKAHRNGYDHAVRSAGLTVVEVETREQLAQALERDAALMYYLGGTSHDWEWETPIPLEECLRLTRAARVPLLVDAANMLPAWENIPRLAQQGVDLIAVSGGKHIRGPQSSGILAGRRELVRAAALNMNPNSDSQGRAMKVNREEMVGLLVALERYVKLDFTALDRACAAQADYLIGEMKRLGLQAEKTPMDRTRRVHRVRVTWEAKRSALTPAQVERALWEGEPRITVAMHGGALEFTVFMNEAGEERLLARRMREILA